MIVEVVVETDRSIGFVLPQRYLKTRPLAAGGWGGGPGGPSGIP
ncbi:hypothetical protein ACYOEI_24485 [Singulisphaera rosea]